ncbi:MAG: 16S rRNA (cytidine(1402)-2'-O)-methyltransferase [Clostridiales bacterium]|nr:16S rRNA (cytidine(1402)-2'-O)-methyltransferase [Clostridiales bacterium]
MDKNENTNYGVLYIVATPIGNLGDITLRAIEVLKSVDFIAAEDTRHTIKLLNHYDIKTRQISHHEHNEKESTLGILMLLEQGKDVALVSDAGMPCISDPGYQLIHSARSKGLPVTSLPGASAIPSAIALSGLDAGRFRFEGFLPKNKTQRKDLLQNISKDGCAIVIYEAPHRLQKTVLELAQFFEDRKIAIINDISKLHERVETYPIEQAYEQLNLWNLKGEFVIVIEKGIAFADDSWKSMTVKEHIESLMQNEDLAKMDAVKMVAKIRGVKKGDVYKESLDI